LPQEITGVAAIEGTTDQVAVAPISKGQAGYSADGYGRADTLSRRFVAAHEMAVPVMAIVGGREMRKGRVSLRERDGSLGRRCLAEAVFRLQVRAGRAPMWLKPCKTASGGMDPAGVGAASGLRRF
jgi:threonyl-tRNA synthetase